MARISITELRNRLAAEEEKLDVAKAAGASAADLRVRKEEVAQARRLLAARIAWERKFAHGAARAT